MRAVVTGSSGFIGRALARVLPGARALRMGSPHWRESLAGVDFAGTVVFHLAARVHEAHAPDAAWISDNVDKTGVLAEAAASGGAARLVFASTIKVHGEETFERPFRAADAYDPRDAYARSKRMAEERLADISQRTGLPIAIVRPALVFGRDATANLRDAVHLASSPWPLPFAAIANRRSWIHVDDLCALLVVCGQHPEAAGRAVIACHTRPFSTPELFGGLREGLGRRAHLYPMSTHVLESAARLIGRGDAMRRLTRSLEGDGTTAREALGWEARKAFSAALDELVGTVAGER